MSLPLVCGPGDGVSLADAEGGYYVVAPPVDLAFAGGFVDVLVVDAGERFGLAEGDHVGVMGVGGFGGHVVSFLCKNKFSFVPVLVSSVSGPWGGILGVSRCV